MGGSHPIVDTWVNIDMSALHLFLGINLAQGNI